MCTIHQVYTDELEKKFDKRKVTMDDIISEEEDKNSTTTTTTTCTAEQQSAAEAKEKEDHENMNVNVLTPRNAVKFIEQIKGTIEYEENQAEMAKSLYDIYSHDQVCFFTSLGPCLDPWLGTFALFFFQRFL